MRRNQQAFDELTFTPGDYEDIQGTSLQGTLRATRRELQQQFGEPHESSDEDPYWDGKVTTEWIVKFDDGLVVTIYDWKRYEQGAPALTEMYDWHVGGRSEAAVERIGRIMPPF